MSAIPDFTETEEWIVQTTLEERYRRDVELQYADAEIRLNPADRELSSCPVFVCEADGCHFVIFKTGDRRYGSQQYGTGVQEFADLTECTVSLQQAQADHMATERGDIEKKAVPVGRLGVRGQERHDLR